MAARKGTGGSARGARQKLAEYRRKRDFTKTAEPSGDEGAAAGTRAAVPAKKTKPLRFVVQKHAASHLHFDFRLELDGVMKSWAVPKGPSLDTTVRRLAMEVEDHPISYNTFEGTIPRGQYGGGTVMLWDRGHYTAADGDVASLRAGLKKGRLDIVMLGERLRGMFTLVRSGRGEGKPQWLLFKRSDEFADPGRDIVAKEVTSIVTGRTMDEIAGGDDEPWQSNRGAGRRAGRTAAAKGAPASKAPARTAPAGTASAKKATRKKATRKKVSAKKRPAKKVSAKKRPAKKVSAKKAPVRKSSAKRTSRGRTAPRR